MTLASSEWAINLSPPSEALYKGDTCPTSLSLSGVMNETCSARGEAAMVKDFTVWMESGPAEFRLTYTAHPCLPFLCSPDLPSPKNKLLCFRTKRKPVLKRAQLELWCDEMRMAGKREIIIFDPPLVLPLAGVHVECAECVASGAGVVDEVRDCSGGCAAELRLTRLRMRESY